MSDKSETDKLIDYLEKYDFETLSHRVALELLARIRTDAERIRVAEARNVRLAEALRHAMAWGIELGTSDPEWVIEANTALLDVQAGALKGEPYEMTDPIQPATDEQINYLEQYDFGTLSHRLVLELLARIRVFAERRRAAQAHNAESEAFLMHQQQRAEANEAKLLEYEGYKLNFDLAVEQRDAAEARCARLAEALKPFAKFADLISDDDLLPGNIWAVSDDVTITMNDLIEAQAALSAPDAQAETSEESHLSPEEVCRNTAQIWMQTEGRFMYGEFTELDVTSLMSVLLRERRAAFVRARDIAFDVGGGLGEEIARLIKIEMKK